MREKIVESFEPGKYEYLMKTCAIMVNGVEPNFAEAIELNRFITALRYIDSPLSVEEIWLLCEVSTLGGLLPNELQI